MALNTTGTRITGSAAADAKGAGFAIPIVAVIDDTQAVVTETINVDKSVVENSDQAVTWTNLSAQFDLTETALSLYFDGVLNDVDMYGTVDKVTLIDDPKYGDVAPFYQFVYTLKAKVTVL